MDKELVFANEAGNPIQPTNPRRHSLVPLLEKAGLKKVRFHDLATLRQPFFSAKAPPQDGF